MRTRKALAWRMAGAFAALGILALYLWGGSVPSPPDVSKVPASEVLEQDKQPRVGLGGAPAVTAPMPEPMEQAEFEAPEVEGVDVDPSGVIAGEMVEEEQPLELEPEATGVLPDGSALEPEPIEQAEFEAPEVETVDVDSSGVIAGEMVQEEAQEDFMLDPAATGIDSP